MLRLTAAGLALVCVIIGLFSVFAATPEQETTKIPLRPMIVYEAEPATTIKHSLEWKNGMDTIRHPTLLVGPQLFSTDTNVKADASTAILFSWYDLSPQPENVAQPKDAPRTIRISDKDGEAKFSVGPAAFFLSITQSLNDGAPAEPPKHLSQFVAYAVVEAESAERNVELPTAEGPNSFVLMRAAYVCLPTQEWHHDEYFGVSDPSSGWIVYQIEPLEHSGSISTLDQFGFNKLELGVGRWLCLPTTIQSIDES